MAGRARSLPSRERGSKHDAESAGRVGTCRSLRGSVDRNWGDDGRPTATAWSLPSRERGSKPKVSVSLIAQIESLPSRERGSKLAVTGMLPHSFKSLPSRERGSKHRGQMHADPPAAGSRSLRGSVDRNIGPDAIATVLAGRSLRGSVDRNQRDRSNAPRSARRSLRGSVDRNETIGSAKARRREVAPFAGAWIETCRSCAR